MEKESESKYLAKSVSQSGASNTSSNDDDVNVTIAGSGSAFSASGGYAFHALRRGLRGNDTVLPGKNHIVERNEAEHRAKDPNKRVLICHFGMRIRATSRMRRRTTRAAAATMALALDVLPCFAGRLVNFRRFGCPTELEKFWRGVFSFIGLSVTILFHLV